VAKIHVHGDAPLAVGTEIGPRSRFRRHFVEMLIAMAVGMFVGTAIFLLGVGMTFDEATAKRPTAILIVMALSMTVPMVGWMRFRGHPWERCAEMAAAMVVPLGPFLALVWSGATETAQCGIYCALTVPAMYIAMRYRRDDYEHDHAGGHGA
jgi:hypothetical protein